jgi:hypothetical protein
MTIKIKYSARRAGEDLWLDRALRLSQRGNEIHEEKD